MSSASRSVVGQAGGVVPAVEEIGQGGAVDGFEALAEVVERDRLGGAYGEDLPETGEGLLVAELCPQGVQRQGPFDEVEGGEYAWSLRVRSAIRNYVLLLVMVAR